MKTYKKISLLLLLSTPLINAYNYNPYDTSGNPSIDDIDDQSGDFARIPSREPSKKTVLEKEVEKQKYTEESPKKIHNPYQQQLAEKRQREEAAKKAKEAADAEQKAYVLSNYFFDLCLEIEKQNQARDTYNKDLEEIAEKKNLGRYEKAGIGIAIIASAAYLITNTVEDAPKYAVIALASGFGTARSYISRRRSCNREEQELMATHQTKLEQTTTKTKAQLIKEAEAVLTQLKSMSVSTAQIANFEDCLNKLRA